MRLWSSSGGEQADISLVKSHDGFRQPVEEGLSRGDVVVVCHHCRAHLAIPATKTPPRCLRLHLCTTWPRYLDKEGKYPIPADNLVLTSAYLTRREHIVHCKYALRQTHLWVTKGWDVPFNYNHTLHCTAYLVDTIMCVTICFFAESSESHARILTFFNGKGEPARGFV